VKRLRLLGVTTSFPLRADASAGVFVRRLYEHLPDSWRIDVVCPADDLELPVAVAADSRIRLRPVAYAPRRWQVLAQQPGGIASGVHRWRWRLALSPALVLALWWRCLLDGRRVELMHANWAVCGAVAAAAAALIRCPLITTLRGDDVARADRSIFDRWALRAAIGGSRVIICVSEAMAADLRARYPGRAGDIRVCLNGVDASFFAVRRSPPMSGQLRVVAVGSLIRRKGFDILVEALALIRGRGNIRVRIAGAGAELGTLRRRAATLGVDEYIEFVGALAPREVPQFLADADVFALPSRSEGRPNVVLEALAAGLPVISADLPGVDGLVNPGVNGWRVAIDDVAGFAAALDQACADSVERERRAAAARAGMLHDGHSWAVTGACYDQLFRGIVASRTGKDA